MTPDPPECRCRHPRDAHNGDGTCAVIDCSCTAYEPRRRYSREDFKRDQEHRRRTGSGLA